ncbi:hypothetical protein BOTBODRAFT_28698 [Botryobasidium botryosum FD-172 SS1]|uniref:XLF-like N-terminal domain-containing protein n=1 Tax=Botryobasidium botryosum (strain FD-172 SS1) TaxID=930990 RepID=A0A067N3F0_BOTB1|nr:hypothetical protein BOTBODRAFT_28698 [Botryobasidium botryosum FD-172 SS1]
MAEESYKHHLQALLDQPWLVKTDEATNLSYLFKFTFSLDALSCCFLVTDTKTVWIEAKEGKYLARRARNCNPSASRDGYSEPRVNEEDERHWRREQLTKLAEAHSMRMIEDLDFSVKAGTDSDLEIFIASPQISWRWDVVSPGASAGSEILFKHLVLPLINVAGLAFNSSEAFSTMTDASLTQSLDKMARTTRVTGSHTELRKFFSKPRVATALQRAAQVVAYSSSPNVIISSLDETSTTGENAEMSVDRAPTRLQPETQQATSSYTVAKSEPVQSWSPTVAGPSTKVHEHKMPEARHNLTA